MTPRGNRPRGVFAAPCLSRFSESCVDSLILMILVTLMIFRILLAVCASADQTDTLRCLLLLVER